MSVATTRFTTVTASIGAGHDLPAELLTAALRRRAAQAQTIDALAAANALGRRLILDGSRFHSAVGNRLFDLEHRLVSDLGPTRELAGRIAGQFGRRGLLGAVGRTRPDVVVSTYPGATEALGRARRSGHLPVPLVAVITDLAALRFWATPGADLHLVTHPESIPEVRRIAGPDAEVVAVRGFDPPGFAAPPSRARAREELGLGPEEPVVLVSGGGWGVGDVEGAVAQALALDCRTLVLCGTNAGLRARIDAAHAGDPRVRVYGFTDTMPTLMAAADVLVHSTAGLTILEAAICGCHAISYGWGRGHIRANNAAFAQHGLAHVAPDRPTLAALLARCLEEPREPDAAWHRLPWAADVLAERYES